MSGFWIPVVIAVFLPLGVSGQDEDPVKMNNEAIRLLDEGRYDSAIRKLVTAHNLDPESELILKNLAAAYVRRAVHEGDQGNLYAAVEDIKAALKRVPKDPQYHYFQSIYHYRLGELPAAGDSADRALALKPPEDLETKIKRLKGNILYLGDRLNEALHVFQGLVSRDGRDRESDHMVKKIKREQAIQREYQQDISTYFKLFYDEEALHLDLDCSLIMLLERERGRVCADLNHFPRVRITVIIYRPDDFNAVTDSEGWVGGLFDRKIRIPLTASNRHTDTIAQVVRHEYTHVVVYELAPGCPAWINEGLASYEQYPHGTGKERIKAWLARGGKVAPFEKVPLSFMSAPDPSAIRGYYIQSHSMMEFLIDRYGLGKIRLLLRELNKKGDWTAAFRRAFSRSFETTEQDWLDSLH